MSQLTQEQYRKGREYRAVWYKVRGIEMVFPWNVLSEETKRKWAIEADAADGLGA